MKAILVVDKPESCTSCLLGIYNKKWFCLATNKDIDITDRYNIPEWCPLKPLPKWKDVPETIESNRDWESWGYDQCIGEILGDAEGETE